MGRKTCGGIETEGGVSDWNLYEIGGWLCRYTFARKLLLLVPNCSWPGAETDFLLVTTDRRVVDVELKMSVADLKRDAVKDKWFHSWDYKIDGPYRRGMNKDRRPRAWPRRVWKHYYLMPKDTWKPELEQSIQPVSGVLLMEHCRNNHLLITCCRRARPCRDAERIDADDCLDIARLAGLRMWNTYDELRRLSERRSGQAPSLDLQQSATDEKGRYADV